MYVVHMYIILHVHMCVRLIVHDTYINILYVWHVCRHVLQINQKYSNLLGINPLDIATIANFVLSTRVSSGIKPAASWYNFVISWFCDTWGSGSTVRVNIYKKMKNHQ